MKQSKILVVKKFSFQTLICKILVVKPLDIESEESTHNYSETSVDRTLSWLMFTMAV